MSNLQSFNIIVIGASAGGVEALRNLVAQLPPDLPASLFVVIHFPENAISVLPRILNRQGSFGAENPRDGEPIEKGKIYVAPPGCHMLLKKGTIRLVRGPKENGHRPAIDPLFRTAARSYGPQVVGVILSGLLDDGVVGANAIKQCGGRVFVQNPDDALFGDMPRNTIGGLEVDFVGTVVELAEELTKAARKSESSSHAVVEVCDEQTDITELAGRDLPEFQPQAMPSVFTCPECNGTLFEITENGVKHFRCRVGHAYTHEGLEVHQTEELEAALWEALRAMEENSALCQALLDRATKSGRATSVRHYKQKLEAAQKRIALVRSVLNQTMLPVGNTDGP